MSNVKFIDKSCKLLCWGCGGIGCNRCDYTGMWKKHNYYLIYTDKKGQKIAFQVDGIK